MAENIKGLFEELFKGKDAAIEKYAKVRHVQYEMNLWRNCGLPLSEVTGSAKVYFSKRFLENKKIASASEEELVEAFKRLNHAVKDGCHGRCVRLIEDLNKELVAVKVEPVTDIEGFLNWLTFCYNVPKDDFTGNSVKEPGFSFEIRIFYDAENRREFWTEIKSLLKEGKIMPMSRVAQLVMFKRKLSVNLKGD